MSLKCGLGVVQVPRRIPNEFDFQCNYSHILYRFRDKARYGFKIAIFFIPASTQQKTVVDIFVTFFITELDTWPLRCCKYMVSTTSENLLEFEIPSGNLLEFNCTS